MSLSPQDHPRQLGKPFDDLKMKAHKYGGRSATDIEQNKEIQIIKKQLFDRIFDEKESLRRNNGGNKSLTIGIHNSGVNDPEESSKRTGEKYQSTLCSRKTTNELELKVKKLENENENLLEVVKKREQQIYHLKETIREKQNTIYDKEKIIRRFLMEKTEHMVEGTAENKSQQQLLSANLTIQALKNEIFNHLQNEHRLKQVIDSLEEKNKIPFPTAGKQKQYEERIKEQRLELEEIEKKTRELKKQHAKLDALKLENRHLRQVIQSYETDPQPSPNAGIESISQKIQSDMDMVQQLGDADNYRTIQMQKMINDLIQKLQARNARLKQKQQKCKSLLQTQHSFTLTIAQKSQEIQEIRTILSDVNLSLENSEKLIEQYKKQIQFLTEKLQVVDETREEDMNRLSNQMRHLSEENKNLAKKNIEMNESVINNLNELESIEKINEEITERLEKEKEAMKKMGEEIEEKNKEIRRLEERVNELREEKENEDEKSKREKEQKIQIEELEKKIQELLNDKQKGEKSIEQFELKIFSLENEKQQFVNSLKQTQSLSQSSTQQLITLSAQNTALQATISSLQSQLTAAQQTSSQLQSKLSSLSSQFQQLKTTSSTKQHQLVTSHATQLQTLQQELEARFKQQLSAVSLSSDEQSTKMNELFNQNNTLNDKLIKSQQELSEILQQSQKIKQELETKLSSQTQMIQQLTTSSLDQQSTIQSLGSKLQTLQAQNSSLSSQLSSQTQFSTTLTAQNNTFQQTIHTLTQQNNQIASQLSQLQSLKLQIQSKLSHLSQSNKTLQQAIQEYEQKMSQLQAQKSAQQTQQKSIETLTNAQINELSETNAALEKNATSLSQQLGLANNRIDELTNVNKQREQEIISKNNKIQELQCALEQNRQELLEDRRRLQTVLDEKQSLETRYKQQITALSLSSDEHASKINVLFSENNEYKNRIPGLEKEIERLGGEVSKAEEKIVGFEALVQCKELEYNQLKQENEWKEQSLAHEYEIKLRECEVKRQEEEERSHEVVGLMKSEIKSLKQQKEVLMGNNNSLGERVKELEKELKLSNESLENFIEQTVNKESHIHLLEKEIEEVKQEAGDGKKEMESKYSKQLQQAREQNKIISQNYQTLLSELQSIQLQNEKLSKQFQDLKQTNEALKQENNEYQLKISGSNISDKSDNSLTSLSIDQLIEQVEKLKAQQKEYNQFISQKQNQIRKKEEEYNTLMGEYNLLREQIEKISKQFEVEPRDSLDEKDNDMEQKIQAIVNSLAEVYHHEQITTKMKSFLLQCLEDCGIIGKEKEKGETMNEILKDKEKIGKTEISETVTGVISNNARLSGHVIHFLEDLVQANDNLVIETEKIEEFCMNLKEFEDEVEKKLIKLEQSVVMYLKAVNEVFHYKAQEIQNVSESRSVRFSQADESFSEKPIMPYSISFQNLLKSQQQITPIKPTLQQLLQDKQSVKLFQDMKKQIAFVFKQQKLDMFSKDLSPSQQSSPSPSLNKSLQNSGSRSKPSAIKATFIDDQQSDESELQSLDSQKPQTYKDQYQSNLKNKMMQISRNPYKKRQKKREQE